MPHLLEWRGLVDLFVLAAAIYFVLHWSRQARALRVTFGILALEAGAMVSTRVGLPITSWVRHASAVAASLVLIVLFQPELRHALSRLEITLRSPRQRAVLQGVLEAIANATFSLATAKRGALLVIERREPVAELVRGGVPLGGQVSLEIGGSMAHRIAREKLQSEKQLIQVLQLDLMAELERKLRTLTEGKRLAELLSSNSVDASGSAQRAAVATLTRLVDDMLTANLRIRETLLWLKENVTDLSKDLSSEKNAPED